MKRLVAWFALCLLLVATFAAAASAAGDEISSATPMMVGDTVNDALSVASNARDVWSLPLVGGEEVTITVMPTGDPGGSGTARLLAPGCPSVAKAGDYGLIKTSISNRTYVDSYARWAFTPAVTGTYYILLNATESSTGYSLSVVRTTNPPIMTPDTNDIPGMAWGGGQLPGVVESRTDPDDVYAVKLFAGEPVTLRMAPINNVWNNGARLYVLKRGSSSIKTYSGWSRAKTTTGTDVAEQRAWASMPTSPNEIAVIDYVPPSTGLYYLWVRSTFIGGGFPYSLELVGHAETPVLPTKAVLGTPSAPSTAYRNKGFTSSGTVSWHKSGTTCVTIKASKKYGKSWLQLRSYAATAKDASGGLSKFSATVKLPYTGSWKLVAYHADDDHLPTTSKTRYVTVK